MNRRMALLSGASLWSAGCALRPPHISNDDAVRAVTDGEIAFARTMADRDHRAFLVCRPRYAAFGATMRFALGLLLMLFAVSARAAEGPYDEQADAPRDVQRALADAAATGSAVLIVFGANWCPDCRILDMTMKQEPTATLVARQFRVVKVDVGRFNRNVGIADAYGVPLASGIPAIAIVSPRNDVLLATRAGELADARKMGEAGIHAFFRRAAGVARPGS